MAKSNMEQAEVEAAECRKQAERMLEVTKQLTERNSSLSSECEILKEKVRALNNDLILLFTFIFYFSLFFIFR